LAAIMDRRRFLRHSGVVGIGFLGLQQWACRPKVDPADAFTIHPYGPLRPDPAGLLELPDGFSYRVLSRMGERMEDGLLLPGAPDGMAAFRAGPDHCWVVRNHELAPEEGPEKGPYGPDYGLLERIDPEKLYDFGRGRTPGVGGTTTFRYNLRTGAVDHQHLSLAGTVRNCAGGPTPNGTWLSCEEDVSDRGDALERDHGYVFEVRPSAEGLADPRPIRAMGRFNHEAVAVDNRTGFFYLTEDRPDGCLYRFLPNDVHDLHAGGRLQALMIEDRPGLDTRNWDPASGSWPVGELREVQWLDLDNVDAPGDDLRHRAQARGAAIFARGEGIWSSGYGCYFACTNGGPANLGQVFCLLTEPGETLHDPNNREVLQLYVQPDDSALLTNGDNLTVSAYGHVVLCEDNPRPRILGIDLEGRLYPIARNVGYESEFAGACFSPDGSTLFVNIQHAGITLAIRGPWEKAEVL
jgi:secreted PhoX family phosphatase